MKRSKILTEIDETLDQLIKNGTVLNEVTADPLYQSEVHTLQKMQESLLARLVHLDSFLKERPEDGLEQSIYTKLTLFSELSSNLAKRIQTKHSPRKVGRIKKQVVR